MCSAKKVLIEILLQLPATSCNFIKKETLTQVFSNEFCKISKNTISAEHLRTTASPSEMATSYF